MPSPTTSRRRRRSSTPSSRPPGWREPSRELRTASSEARLADSLLPIRYLLFAIRYSLAFALRAVLMSFVRKTHRFGLITPSSNSTQEPEFSAALPPTISLHTGRVAYRDITPEEQDRCVLE